MVINDGSPGPAPIRQTVPGGKGPACENTDANVSQLMSFAPR